MKKHNLSTIFLAFVLPLVGISQPNAERELILEEAITANIQFDFKRSIKLFEQIDTPNSNADTVYILGQIHLAHAKIWMRDYEGFKDIKDKLEIFVTENKVNKFSKRITVLDAIFFAHKKNFKAGYTAIRETIDGYEKAYSKSNPDWVLWEPYLAFLTHFTQKFELADDLYQYSIRKFANKYPEGSSTEYALRLLLSAFYHYQGDWELADYLIEDTRVKCTSNFSCQNQMGSYFHRWKSTFALNQKQYKSALQSAHLALIDATSERQKAGSYNSLATAYGYLGKLDSAKFAFNSGFSSIISLNDSISIVQYIQNYAQSIASPEQLDQILELYNLAEIYSGGLDRGRSSYGGNTYIPRYLFKYYLKNKDYKNSLKYWNLYVSRENAKLDSLNGWENPSTKYFSVHTETCKQFMEKSDLAYSAYKSMPDSAHYLDISIDAGRKADSIIQKLIVRLSNTDTRQRLLIIFAKDYSHLVDRAWEYYNLDQSQESLSLLLYFISVVDDMDFAIMKDDEKKGRQNSEFKDIIVLKDSLNNLINTQSSEQQLNRGVILHALRTIELDEKLNLKQHDAYSLEEIEDILNQDYNLPTIVYYSNGTTLYSIGISSSGSRAFKTTLDHPVDSLVLEYRNILLASVEDRSTRRKFMEIERTLKTHIIYPFKELFKHPKVTIIANGHLGILPFESIVNSELGEKSPAIHQTYFSSFNTGKSESNEEISLAIFRPSFDKAEGFTTDKVFRSGYLGKLPYAHEEQKAIKYSFPKSHIYESSQASKEQLRNAFQNNSIVHLITHAKQDNEHLERSFIALNDKNGAIDSLNYLEVSGMGCNAEMVVLSSCETGIGPYQAGIGIKSFARSIMSRGAKSVICTLWPVNDKSTSLIMDKFYVNLKEGQSKDVALKNAKNTYLSIVDEEYQHPYYWAGIIAIGDMSPIIYPYEFRYGIIAFIAVLVLICSYLYFRRASMRAIDLL